MEIISTRKTFTDKSTISEVTIDGVHECFFLEDTDRGLDSSMSSEQLHALKIPKITAIPYGRYKVIVTKSERFSKEAGHDVYLPLLLNVPAFDGVRLHSGNKPEHTDGCPLTGTTEGTNQVLNSRTAFISINDKINIALKQGKEVWITITKKGL